MLTSDELKKHVCYEPTTGAFTRVASISNRVRIGEIAGSRAEGEYKKIRINGKRYFAHRLAWLYIYGSFPEGVVDHINGVGSDNRIENLRVASAKQNAWNQCKKSNNTTGFKNVFWRPAKQKYEASFRSANGNRVIVGFFDTKEEAHSAYVNRAMADHGEFFNAGTL